MKKNIAILFSGGLDSTYLMWKALKDGHNAYPIYISIKNNSNKVTVEKQQSNLIIRELNNEFDTNINLHEFANIEVGDSSNLTLPQPFLWSTLVNVGGGLDDFDELQIGYVMGDDAIGYIDEIKKLYRATKPFIVKQPKLTFPITKVYKNEIVNRLPEQYLKLITSCENPNLKSYGITINGGITKDVKYRFFEPCGECLPCEKTIDNNYFGSNQIEKNYRFAESRYFTYKIMQYQNKLNRHEYLDKAEFNNKENVDYIQTK